MTTHQHNVGDVGFFSTNKSGYCLNPDWQDGSYSDGSVEGWCRCVLDRHRGPAERKPYQQTTPDPLRGSSRATWTTFPRAWLRPVCLGAALAGALAFRCHGCTRAMWHPSSAAFNMCDLQFFLQRFAVSPKPMGPHAARSGY